MLLVRDFLLLYSLLADLNLTINSDFLFICYLDAIGVVKAVTTIRKFPYVCRLGGTDYESRYVAFKLVDIE